MLARISLSPRDGFQRRLLHVATAIVAAYYALWACAPAATMRPMTLTDELSNETGGAFTYTGLVDAGGSCEGGEFIVCSPGANLQIDTQHRLGRWFSLGGTLAGGTSVPVAAIVAGRVHLVERDTFHLGVDLQAGFLSAGLGVPMAWRVMPKGWLYTEPSFALRQFQPFRLPVGFSFGITDHFWATGEVAYGVSSVASTRTGSGLVETGAWSTTLGLSAHY